MCQAKLAVKEEDAVFQELQASGILLCYVPLALVLGGFIVFAAMTDKIATSDYLRRLNPEPEAERDDSPFLVRQPVNGLTPSGLAVTILPEAAPAAATRGVAPTAADDLSRLEGIGPKIKSVLMAAGITTFSQVAAMTPEAIRTILVEAGLTGINDPSTWPEQAALAAAGKWTELDKLQDELQGGRRV